MATKDSPLLPSGDRILLERLKGKTMTDGGIHIPGSGYSVPDIGVVISCGSRVMDTNLTKKVMVIMGKYAGQEIKVGGKDYVLIRESEVQCIITDPEVIKKYLAEGA